MTSARKQRSAAAAQDLSALINDGGLSPKHGSDHLCHFCNIYDNTVNKMALTKQSDEPATLKDEDKRSVYYVTENCTGNSNTGFTTTRNNANSKVTARLSEEQRRPGNKGCPQCCNCTQCEKRVAAFISAQCPVEIVEPSTTPPKKRKKLPPASSSPNGDSEFCMECGFSDDGGPSTPSASLCEGEFRASQDAYIGECFPQAGCMDNSAVVEQNCGLFTRCLMPRVFQGDTSEVTSSWDGLSACKQLDGKNVCSVLLLDLELICDGGEDSTAKFPVALCDCCCTGTNSHIRLEIEEAAAEMFLRSGTISPQELLAICQRVCPSVFSMRAGLPGNTSSGGASASASSRYYTV
jgi:hypothetical protein